MSTVTDSRPAVQTCRLTLTISGVDHSVRPVPMSTTASTRAFALRAAEGVRFVVSQSPGGCRCTHAGCEGETACHHARALVALGLFRQPAASPVVFPRATPQRAARAFGEGLEEATPVVAPRPAKVDAIAWATAICGKLWAVATKEQKDLAVSILNDDSGHFYGRAIAPVGPSLEELAATLGTGEGR